MIISSHILEELSRLNLLTPKVLQKKNIFFFFVYIYIYKTFITSLQQADHTQFNDVGEIAAASQTIQADFPHSEFADLSDH